MPTTKKPKDTWHKWAGSQRLVFSEQACGDNPHMQSYVEYSNGVMLLVYYHISPLSVYEHETQKTLNQFCRKCFMPSNEILIIENSGQRRKEKYTIKVEYHARCSQPTPETILNFIKEVPSHFILKSEEDLAEERKKAYLQSAQESSKEYRIEHAAEIRKNSKEYYWAHREEMMERGREYRAKKKAEKRREIEEKSSEVYFLTEEDQEFFDEL